MPYFWHRRMKMEAISVRVICASGRKLPSLSPESRPAFCIAPTLSLAYPLMEAVSWKSGVPLSSATPENFRYLASITAACSLVIGVLGAKEVSLTPDTRLFAYAQLTALPYHALLETSAKGLLPV